MRSQTAAVTSAGAAKSKTDKKARFISFRDDDGSFRFRLQAAGGDQLLLSEPFADPRSAGKIIKRLEQGLPEEAVQQQGDQISVVLDDVLVCTLGPAQLAAVREALADL